MQQLAEALGIAAGGIYHYFSGKEALLIAICDELTEPLLEAALRLLDDGQAGATPELQLQLLVRLWVAQVVDRRNHMLVFQQERHLIEHGDKWKNVRDSRKAFERLVDYSLRRCMLAVGDRRLALSALLGMVNYTAQWYGPRGRLTVDEIADGYVALLLTRPA